LYAFFFNSFAYLEKSRHILIDKKHICLMFIRAYKVPFSAGVHAIYQAVVNFDYSKNKYENGKQNKRKKPIP
jgi:hypothetical protein